MESGAKPVVHRMLQTMILAACLSASLLAGAGEAAEVQLRPADSTRIPICNAAPPAFADFDQNGIADRVDSSDASGRRAVWLTLNGRQRIILAEVSEACRLLVLDIDHDADVDLVALTTAGRLLIWRNQGGALGLVQPQQKPDAATRSMSLRERARPPDSLVLSARSLPCIIPAAQAYGPPFQTSRIVDIAGRHRTAGSHRSASRAPPTC